MGSLPPGFRFYPSEEELIIHFLYRKAAILPSNTDMIIPTLHFHECDPWQLQGKALRGGKQWYFFCPRTQNRATAGGCWRPVGDDKVVSSGGSDVGIRKTLVFFAGGVETGWFMHEYHLLGGVAAVVGSSFGAWKTSKKRGSSDIDFNKWVVYRAFEATYDTQASLYKEDGMELSCLDEVFLSLDDDYDEVISLPK